MCEWKEKLLSDLAILYNDSWKVGDEECPYIALEHIEEGKLRLSGISHSDIVTSNKYRFNDKNFLFGKLRPYFRKVIRPQFSGICSTDIWVVGARGEMDLKFLFYLFANKKFVDLAYSGSSGTRMPRADWKFMKDTVWFIPSDIEEQRAIASVLSSLDDKIDLLHRQNKTLESMAETLFRQWFVEEADEGWEEKTLDDCLELIIDYRGKTPKKLGADWSLSGIPAISAKNIKNGRLIRPETFKYVDIQLYKKWMKDELQRGDIILTSEAPLGELYLLNSDEKFVLSQRLFGLRPKKNVSPYFIFCFLSSRKGQYLMKRRASGSTVLGIRQSELRDVEIVLPPKQLVKEFGEIAGSYYIKIKNNNNQIRTLEKLRDILLPKLMSGEVIVELKQQEAVA